MKKTKTLTVISATVLFILSFSSSVHAANQHGLGFGFAAAGASGGSLFYDYNGDRLQLHFQGTRTSETQQNIFGTSKAVFSQSIGSVTWRKFFDKPGDKGGFFVGAGVGGATSTLTYTDTSIFSSSSTTNYEVVGGGSIALLDIGWQGSDGYYFTIDFMPSSFVTYEEKDTNGDEFSETDIPNTSNHRTTAVAMWAKAKTVSVFNIAFGWFF